MTVSVIVPTFEAGPGLDQLLVRIEEQQLVPDDVVVIDSGSEDGTPERAARHGCTVVDEPRFDHGGTRNRAVQHAQGEVLVFVTQDVVPATPRWLERLVAPIVERTACASFGRQLAHVDAPMLERTSRTFSYPAVDRITTMEDVRANGFRSLFFSDANSAIARTCFESLGGFTEGTIFGEDVDFAYRLLAAGERIHYRSEASVWHTHRYTPSQSARRYFDIGVAHAQHPEWLAQAGGPSRSGVDLARATADAIVRERRFGETIPTLANLAARYLGYRFGRSYRRLPPSMRRALSMNRRYWEADASR